MKGSLLRIKALINKEFIQIIYDPSSILITVFLPLLLLFLYGFGVSLDLNHLSIGLALQDTNPDSMNFAQTLLDSKYFNVTVARNEKELIAPLLSGHIRGIVVVPPYFSEFKQNKHKTAPIQVIADGSEPNTANFVQNYVRQAWNIYLQQEKIKSGSKMSGLATLQPRFWYNEGLESRNFLVPGSLAIIMTLIGTLLTALVISREWERGTMEALMSTPVSIIELLIGKLVPYFFLGMVSMGLCVTGAVLFYHIPFRGSWFALGLTTSCFLITALGLGLFVSTATKNQFAASQAATVSAFLPAYMLSGFIFDISSMPIYIQVLTYFVPARYFVTCLLTIFLVGDVWPLIILNMIPMLLIGAVFIFMISRITVKRLD